MEPGLQQVFSPSLIFFCRLPIASDRDIAGLLVNDSKDEQNDYKEATYSSSCCAKSSKTPSHLYRLLVVRL